MGFSATLFLSPSLLKHRPSQLDLKRNPLLLIGKQRRPKRSHSIVSVARLLGPAIFEASKLKVVFVGEDAEKYPKLPRTYTLTHSDVTSKLTLAISDTINMSRGWYNRLQRDEVVAEWKKVKGKMSLHVHCHISGGHFLLDFIANLRYYIFSRELPVVLKAFVHGDVNLFNKYPELEEAPVWVYFQSTLPEFNRVECWGPLREASSIGRAVRVDNSVEGTISSPLSWVWPQRCQEECDCCFPPRSLISCPHHQNQNPYISTGQTQD